MTNRIILTIGVAAMIGSGCERKSTVVIEPAPPVVEQPPVARTQTFETHALRKAIDAYELEPSVVQSARVKKAFAEIDGEIAELVEHVAKKVGSAQAEAAQKLADLRSYRESEMARFRIVEAKVATKEVVIPPPRSETIGEKVGEKIDQGARKVEEGLREAADKLREKTR